MQSPTCFIATPFGNKRYDNTKVMGEVEIVTSTSEENHKASNRLAVVQSVPLEYNGPIEKGDILLVHHNVFKFYNDISGKRKSGKSHLWEELFLIDNEQFFMYKKDGAWHAHDRYCFVKPLPPGAPVGEGAVIEGATLTYTRGVRSSAGGLLISVLGEVPMVTARLLADAVRPPREQS